MIARHATVRRPGVSLRLDLRVGALLGLLAVLTVVVFVFNIGRGEFPIAPLDVVKALVGTGDEANQFIVTDLRLPRALTAILAGAALGIAGALFQDLARNPLVAPDIIGITTGASLAAISVIILAETDNALVVPLAALGGAIVTGVALYALAWRNGLHGYRLVLIGIGVNALGQAGISYVLTKGRIFDVSEAYLWYVGTLNGVDWTKVWPLLAGLVVLVPVALLLCRGLSTMQLGDEVARSLGIRLERSRFGLLAIAVVLTGLSVYACGPIAFVAFVSPHIARRLIRSASPVATMVVAALCGAILLSGADLVGRLLFAPTEIPVGIITSIIAAPYFLYLLHRASRSGVIG